MQRSYPSYFSSFLVNQLIKHNNIVEYTGCPRKNVNQSSIIFQIGRKSATNKSSCIILSRGLGMVSAKDGWYIFINKKVMAIFVRHVFYRRIHEFHLKMRKCTFRHTIFQFWKTILRKVFYLLLWFFYHCFLDVSGRHVPN